MAMGWPSVTGGMDWQHHSWQRNPFNRPPVNTAAFVPPPDPLSCPNPTGSTNVADQIWGAQGEFAVFRCPSQPFDHSSLNPGSVITSVLNGLPTIDMPRGNPFADPSLGLPQCADTNSLAPAPGCSTVGSSFPPGEYTLGRSDYTAVVGAFVDSGFTALPLTPAFAQKYRGLFNYRASAGLSNIPDGTSNTLLFSEYCGRVANNFSQVQSNGWVAGSWAMNGQSSVYGACPDPNNDMANGGYCDYKDSRGGGLTLGGWHQGLFNVVFADGSVRLIRTDINRTLLLSLTGYNDGDVIGSDF
jgi:prepilin-type processing-associated H-X9-DG protein